MSLINDKLKLKEQAIVLHENRQDCFGKIDQNLNSYYIEKDNADSIQSYYFDEPLELQEYLEWLWKGKKDDMLNTFGPGVIASAYKHRYTQETQEETGSGDAENNLEKVQSDVQSTIEIPDFVYAF